MSVADCPEPGVLTSNVDETVSCVGAAWVPLQTVADFDFSSLDLNNMLTGFGVGFSIMITFFVATKGVAVVLKMISGKR